MTSLDYENMIFGAYSRWCESVTINARDFQKVLANSAINKWFLFEYAKCEAEFNLLTDRYEGSVTVSTDDLKICYIDCTHRILNIRPTALLQEIKTTKSMSCLKVHGVKILSLTLNQN